MTVLTSLDNHYTRRGVYGAARSLIGSWHDFRDAPRTPTGATSARGREAQAAFHAKAQVLHAAGFGGTPDHLMLLVGDVMRQTEEALGERPPFLFTSKQSSSRRREWDAHATEHLARLLLDVDHRPQMENAAEEVPA